jgi:TrmH family RNA methyltransferase
MSGEVITSASNPRIKQWAQLLERKGRDKQGKYLIEGNHLVSEALAAGVPLEAVLYDPERGVPAELAGAGATGGGAPWVAASAAALAKLCDAATPQPIVAVAAMPPREEAAPERAAAWAADPRALVVVVDGVQDPGNLGTIIRCADAVAATGVIVGRGSADVYNPKTLRATMGSLFHLPIVSGVDLPPLLAQVAAGGVGGVSGPQVVGATLRAELSCYDADLTQPTWLVLGNEGAGVSPAVAACVTREVCIPMPGRAESLNVAMAATVLLFEALRQRGERKF